MSQRTDSCCFYLPFPLRGRIFSFCHIPQGAIGLCSGRDGEPLGLIPDSGTSRVFFQKVSFSGLSAFVELFLVSK